MCRGSYAQCHGSKASSASFSHRNSGLWMDSYEASFGLLLVIPSESWAHVFR
jgi:hypothetical protein